MHRSLDTGRWGVEARKEPSWGISICCVNQRHRMKDNIPPVYSSTVRSVLEYASPVYGPMLNSSQSEDIEKLQRRTLKIIYEYSTSYRRALEISGLTTLEDRRQETLKKFTFKCASNPLYDRWFPVHQPYRHELRNQKKYVEKHANTDCLYKSPIYTMRHLLNNLWFMRITPSDWL